MTFKGLESQIFLKVNHLFLTKLNLQFKMILKPLRSKKKVYLKIQRKSWLT